MIEIILGNHSKHDVQTYFNLYQVVGVKEYSIIQPFDKIILVYTFVSGEFIGLKPQLECENTKSPLFSVLVIAIEAVFL
jgi:Uma2 family endonuclease